MHFQYLKSSDVIRLPFELMDTWLLHWVENGVVSLTMVVSSWFSCN